MDSKEYAKVFPEEDSMTETSSMRPPREMNSCRPGPSAQCDRDGVVRSVTDPDKDLLLHKLLELKGGQLDNFLVLGAKLIGCTVSMVPNLLFRGARRPCRPSRQPQ